MKHLLRTRNCTYEEHKAFSWCPVLDPAPRHRISEGRHRTALYCKLLGTPPCSLHVSSVPFFCQGADGSKPIGNQVPTIRDSQALLCPGQPLCTLRFVRVDLSAGWAALRKGCIKLVLKAAWSPECPTLDPFHPCCQMMGHWERERKQDEKEVRNLARWEIRPLVPFASESLLGLERPGVPTTCAGDCQACEARNGF